MHGPEDWMRRALVHLKSYVYPALAGGVLRMDANTNLIGLNPAIERVARRLADLELNHYPSAFSDSLRAEIARHHGIPSECVIVGNGSDEVIDFVCKAFLEPGEVVGLVAPSFVMQSFYGRVNLGRPVEIPLVPGEFRLEVDALLRLRAKIVMIASPNNPTGNAFAAADLDRLIESSRGIVVIDEAYAEFCGQNFLARAPRTENLIVLRTFSKAHGLAGLRIGYGCATQEMIERLHRVKPPFTVGGFSEEVAIEALRDLSFMEQTVRIVSEERVRLAEGLGKLGATPYRCDANFLMADLGRTAAPVAEALRRAGIHIRPMGDFAGYESCIRLTVGRPEHNRRFLEALAECLR
jgi:histidinol-phosphate aminotransferase